MDIIDDIIKSLESLSREDIRDISDEDYLISKILSFNQSQLMKFCENNYHKYIKLKTQIVKIYMFDNYYQNYDEALQTINETIQVCYFDKQYEIYIFELLYMKTLLFHFFHHKKEANEEALYLYGTLFRDANEARKAKILKLIAMTSEDTQEAIEYSLKALEYFKKFNKTEEGFIYKNLAFHFLKLGNYNESIMYLLEFLNISGLMDIPGSSDVIIISGYLEMLNETKTLSVHALNGIKEFLLNFSQLGISIEKTHNEILILIEK